MFDLVIRGGTVVTGASESVCDIGVRSGKIAQLGGEIEAAHEIDARGLYVFPGGVDVHVHLTSPRVPAPGVETRADDFYSGSLAAIAGGITTIGNMTFQREGETLRDALVRERALAEHDAAVDYLLHPVLLDPSTKSLNQIPELAAEGVTSLKIFLVLEAFDARVDDYLRAVRLAGQNGMITMMHCEDGALIRCHCRELIEQGRGSPRYFADSRPDDTEATATVRAIAIAHATRAPVYIVHLSSAVALEQARRARRAGLTVYVETRPLYLHLTRELLEREDGAKYVGAPPLRESKDVLAIWNGVRNGYIQTVCTDHAPWTLKQKLDPALNVQTARQGVSDLETLRPMLFSEGVLKKRISLTRFVELTSTNPAKLFGLYPTKGTIAIGSDADLVVWDPNARRTIDGVSMQSRSGYSVYDGYAVQGFPALTISRGEVIFDRGKFSAPRGRGQELRRARTMRL